jgi:hypothetical protein
MNLERSAESKSGDRLIGQDRSSVHSHVNEQIFCGVEAVQCGSYIKDFAIIIEERQKYGQKQ